MVLLLPRTTLPPPVTVKVPMLPAPAAPGERTALSAAAAEEDDNDTFDAAGADVGRGETGHEGRGADVGPQRSAVEVKGGDRARAQADEDFWRSQHAAVEVEDGVGVGDVGGASASHAQASRRRRQGDSARA